MLRTIFSYYFEVLYLKSGMRCPCSLYCLLFLSTACCDQITDNSNKTFSVAYTPVTLKYKVKFNRMSKYHANCTETKDQPEQQDRGRAGPPVTLTSKPFCDCRVCTCKDCPDILELLCISVTENSCAFGSKVKKDTKKGTCAIHDLEQRQSLLGVLNPDRDCTCEVMARAVRSNVHMNIGMSERRVTMHKDSSISQDIQPEK